MPRNNDPKNDPNNNNPNRLNTRRNNRNKNKSRKNNKNNNGPPPLNLTPPKRVYTGKNFKSFEKWYVQTPAGSRFVITLRQIVFADPPFIPAYITKILHLAPSEEYYRREPYYTIYFPFNSNIRMQKLRNTNNYTNNENWRSSLYN